MTTNTKERDAPAIANPGAIFDINDQWKCQCGEVHRFGAYVAAHWNEALTHTCKPCGQKRTFHSGRVLPD